MLTQSRTIRVVSRDWHSIVVTIAMLVATYVGVGAQVWVEASDGLPVGKRPVAMSYDSTHLLLALDDGTLYESHEAGLSWVKVKGLSLNEPPRISGIAQSNNSHWWVIGGDGLFQSVDLGNQWIPKDNFPIRVEFVSTTSLASSGDTIVIVFNGGVLRSNNQGSSWSIVGQGSNYRQLSTASLDRGTLYVGSNYGIVYRQTVNDSELAILDTLDAEIYEFISIDERLFVATEGGVYYSLNQGSTWFRTDLHYRSTSLTQVGNSLFAATSNGIFRTEDLGTTWFEANNGIGNQSIKVIRNYFGVLVAAAQSGRVYRSIGPISVASVAHADIYSLSVSPRSSSGIFSLRGNGLIRVMDLRGVVLSEFVCQPNQVLQIDLTTAAMGMYLIEQTGSLREVVKVLVIH